MANDIPQRQNDEQALRFLAAQRRLYGWAKLALAIQLVFVVLVPGILIITEHLVISFKVWAAFIGLAISILDVAILEPAKAAFRDKAAATQELFDCHVLGLEWPTLKIQKPDREDLHGAAAGYRTDLLKDWYPLDIGQLPLHVGRIICQRSNCWWDSKLRRYYRTVVLGILTAVSVGIVVAGLLMNLTIGDFVLSLMAPMLPLLLWVIREAKQQGEAALRGDHLKSFGDALWEEVMQGRTTADGAAVQSRMFQDEIYDHRRQSPMIFNWFYMVLRKKFESQMTQSAADMIREAREKGL